MKKVKHVIKIEKDYYFSIFMILLANILLGGLTFLCSLLLYFSLIKFFPINHDLSLIFSTIFFCCGMFYVNVSTYNSGTYNPITYDKVEHEIIETKYKRRKNDELF